MANRNKWAHWKESKRTTSDKGVAISLIVFGGLTLPIGVLGLANHVLWFPWFNRRFGSFAIVPTVTFLIAGGVFIAFGLVSLFARK
jgi:hypothetical protein